MHGLINVLCTCGERAMEREREREKDGEGR